VKKYRVGILTKDFVNWGGGIDLITFIVKGLNQLILRGHNLELYLLFERDNKKKTHLFFRRFSKLKFEKYESILIDKLKKTNVSIRIKEYNDLNKIIYSTKIDIIIPSHNPINLNINIPWVGYILDFQHKYFPEFFSIDENKMRDEKFNEILDKSDVILVNSESVKNDITKFYSNKTYNVVKLPLCPLFNLDYYNINVDITKYNLPKNYFLISNQFWVHKDHVTAIKAFKLFLSSSNDKTFGLVCTGSTSDYRFPNYINDIYKLIDELNIKNNVHIIGYVPKEHQIKILQNCIALIQPTLFEGGPGGFSVYESIGYGVRSIVSDIDINLEINDETVCFFSSGNSYDLAVKMKKISESNKIKFSKETLIQKNEKSLNEYADTLLLLFNNFEIIK
jgi:glycosyltransferase involved in cell wall biosynthesis